MPNWNSNSVHITAPAEDVKAYFVEVHEDDGSTRYMFNMHKIFPDDFPIGDPLGQDNWNYEWFCEHTGSKWSPYIYDLSSDEAGTRFDYETARAPNNGTLEQLHKITGWAITNAYEEPGLQLCGQFVCVDGSCNDEELEYCTSCEICEERYPQEDFDEELDGLICNGCRNKGWCYEDDGVTLIRPDGS